MRDEILSHHEIIARERFPMQGGMIFHVRPGVSVFLMSLRPNAPYQDRWDEATNTLVYEGHDIKRVAGGPDPKSVDQPLTLPSGNPTPNGKFFAAAKRTAGGSRKPELIRVYEKLAQNVWTDKGMFHLVDAEVSEASGRKVVEFMLRPIDGEPEADTEQALCELPHTRLIPSHVKLAVWKRDRGRCVQCGSQTNLHYDHDLPFSKGGSSWTEANVRILCAQHNLAKSAKIE